MSRPAPQNSIDLAGRWLIRADPDDTGRRRRWFVGDDDGPEWIEHVVPSAWQRTLGCDFHGVAWLRRTVHLPPSWQTDIRRHRFWLRFDAVATDCRVWVDGREVGHHVGDWVPFQLEITDEVRASSRLHVVARVDECHAPKPRREGDLQGGHITKGFHDVVSLQHGGVWQPVTLLRTGTLCTVPDGVTISADATTGRVACRIVLEPRDTRQPGQVQVTIRAARGGRVHAVSRSVPADEDEIMLETTVPRRQRWSPHRPRLYEAEVRLLEHGDLSEQQTVRFGFRDLVADGSTIRLNGRPLFLRGVLDWGHEPEHVAPCPAPGEVRSRFRRLRRMGFNCVCLCMWYPPRWFHDIADETGMLLWQVHPVWQSPMTDENRAEYRRLYGAFMRRDANHPSVIVVSATCEHPSFPPDLSGWWWREARRMLPARLLEVQTAFFRWADARHGDLHDEHTYDNSDRWVCYLRDLQDRLDGLPEKPFVMGETMLFTAWPDLARIRKRVGERRPWWLPAAFDHRVHLERAWRARYGRATVARFRRQSERFCRINRTFQFEQFRLHPRHAGAVLTHLRDVPAATCGFFDDLGRWRLSPAESRGWLGEVALLLSTPDERRGFACGKSERTLPCRLLLSNFSAADFDGVVELRCDGSESDGSDVIEHRLACPVGAVGGVDIDLRLPCVDRPARMTVTATAGELASNAWDLWLFPPPEEAWPDDVARMEGMPFDAAECAPEDVERGYSRGYGLPVRSWRSLPPDPQRLAPAMRGVPSGTTVPADVRVLLTHRLTGSVIDYLERGGRVVLLASRAAGALGAVYLSLYGQVPLVVEEGPLARGDGAWIVDLLGYDLVRRCCRAVPVDDLDITECVDPLIRLVYTHDAVDRVRFYDMLFWTGVGNGRLIVSSLDHGEDAGDHLLRRIIASARSDARSPGSDLDADRVRSWCAPYSCGRQRARS